MTYSTRERIAHVFRRLGVGIHPDLVAPASDVDDAIAMALDPSATERPAPAQDGHGMAPPADAEEARDVEGIAPLVVSWLERMATSDRMLDERLVWFWHDYFATGLRKVRMPYLMAIQHATIRRLALGSFRDLLHAMATDPAMLFYLDGVQNAADAGNENFAREVMELHTLGPGYYTQVDIAEAAKATSGWVVHVPFSDRARRAAGDVAPWAPFFVPSRHITGPKTILGFTADFDMAGFIDHLLDQPQTPRFVAAKLYRHLTGLDATADVLDRLTTQWDVDSPSTDLVAAIVAEPWFVSDEAIRSKIRTPVERVVGFLQAFGLQALPPQVTGFLHQMAYLPFNPPNPAGFPEGETLLGPFQLTHMFDLANALDAAPDLTAGELMAALGIFDLSTATRATLDAVRDPAVRVALALNSPEYALT